MVYLSRIRLCLLNLVLCCCLGLDSSRAEESSVIDEVEPRALLNTIHSEELRVIMRRLERLAYEREFTALQIQRMRASQIDDLIDATEQLVYSASDISSPALQSLGDDDRVTFRNLAEQLKAITLELKEQGQSNNYAEIERGYNSLRETCNSCHKLFRSP